MTACTSLTAPDIRLPGQPAVGLNVQQHSSTFDAAGQAFTKELGVHSLRLAFNHGDADFGVNWAAQNGIGVLYMLGYGVGCDARTVSGRQCYADRSAGLAQKYGNKVQYYEVWNEWNGIHGPFGGWRENQANHAAYTDLLCRTYKAVKAVQPNAKVVGGVTAGTGTTFIGNMLDAGAGNCMDIVSVHPYPFSEHSEFNVPYNSSATVMANKFVEAITAVDTLVRQKTGRTIPIIVSEEGIIDNAANEQRTADYLTQIYEKARSIPFLEGIWWFNLEDNTDGTYGLLRSNNTKKPALRHLRQRLTSSQRSDRHYQSSIQGW